MRPALYLGRRGGNGILQADIGPSDDSVGITFRAHSNPLLPAGPDGEALFTHVYVAVTWSLGATLTLTPWLDGVELGGEVAVITLGPQTSRRTQVFEVALTLPIDPADPGAGVVGMRGNRLEIVLEAATSPSTVDPTGDHELHIDGVSVELEVVRESMSPVN